MPRLLLLLLFVWVSLLLSYLRHRGRVCNHLSFSHSFWFSFAEPKRHPYYVEIVCLGWQTEGPIESCSWAGPPEFGVLLFMFYDDDDQQQTQFQKFKTISFQTWFNDFTRITTTLIWRLGVLAIPRWTPLPATARKARRHPHPYPRFPTRNLYIYMDFPICL